MYSSICKSEGILLALETIDGIITKGLTYDLIYEVDKEDSIYYETIADDYMYCQLNSKYFFKIK